MSLSSIKSHATGRVVLADVACAAGVSPITVSHALRGMRTVAPALIEHVQAAAAPPGRSADHMGLQHSQATHDLIVGSGIPCLHLMEISRQPGIYSIGFSQEASRIALGGRMFEQIAGTGVDAIFFCSDDLAQGRCWRRCGSA
ncbi:MAG: LacI family DNA-binding transcriptional regulator [Rhodanobacter sp.]|jgi:hypothetical protein|nr:LacI family DNA-binding transcriptional regulator [Rhodanobacter sp.]